MVVLKHIKSQAVSLQAFAPNVSDETAYVINRMLNKEPAERYPSYEELLTHLLYARQKLQKRSAAQGGNTARAATKVGSNRVFLGALWSLAAVVCLAAGAWFFALRPATGGAKPIGESKAWPLIEQGQQELNARHFEAARGHFEAAVAAAGTSQPERNWALAQSGLAALLLDDRRQSQEAFGKLDETAFFDAAPAPQALGRFFFRLAQQMAGARTNEEFSGRDFEAFGLLACGLKNWSAGDVDAGGVLLERFAESAPGAPDGWLSNLKPLAAPYLADYRAYADLRDAAKAPGADAANLLGRIDQARHEVKTGVRMTEKLD